MQVKVKDIYHTGIYLRLSREDSGAGRNAGRPESNSIRSQRELAYSFVRRQEDLEIVDCYTDDGYSGANFDRPEFQRMMRDVRDGRIDCIVVKDLSRFGRDYIEAGRLIQKIFPALQVRFISITDHFDSLTANYGETSLVLPVKNFVNDSYCRDISEKVRSQQRVKRENGEFIGAFAVYGYRKDENNRNRLVPDEYPAQIVKKIFAFKMGGMSAHAIAEKLNAMGTLSPMEYKKWKGMNYSTGFYTGIMANWSSVAVKRILVNEIYTGTLVQGKREKINYKMERYREKSKEEWIKVKNTHEAVISREDFEKVRRLMQIDCRASGGQKKAHLFSGLLFCGDCKQPMVRRVNRCRGKETICFVCSSKNKGRGCTRHSIREEKLKKTVLLGLKMQAALMVDMKQVLEYMKGLTVDFGEPEETGRIIAGLHTAQEQYLSVRDALHMDLEEGVITQEDYEDFRKIYEDRYREIQKVIEKQEKTLRGLFDSGVEAKARLEHVKKMPECMELDRDLLVSLVERIDVYEDKRLCMELRYTGFQDSV